MAVVCTITPASTQAEETHNTLKFAGRAKKVGKGGGEGASGARLPAHPHACVAWATAGRAREPVQLPVNGSAEADVRAAPECRCTGIA